MSERKEPFEAGRSAIRNIAEKFAEPNPTEAEIAAAKEIEVDMLNARFTVSQLKEVIARHNTPLHAKIVNQEEELTRLRLDMIQFEAAMKDRQYLMDEQRSANRVCKAALELAQKAIEYDLEIDVDGTCCRCDQGKDDDDSLFCIHGRALAAIKEALK